MYYIYIIYTYIIYIIYIYILYIYIYIYSLRNRRHSKWLNIRRKKSGFQSSQDSVREFNEQVKGTSFENVTCD